MTLDGTRDEVTAIIGTGKATPSGHIPFTPRAKKTLELALREALQLHHNYIGTEHILLGVIREGEGVAAQIMQAARPDLMPDPHGRTRPDVHDADRSDQRASLAAPPRRAAAEQNPSQASRRDAHHAQPRTSA